MNINQQQALKKKIKYMPDQECSVYATPTEVVYLVNTWKVTPKDLNDFIWAKKAKASGNGTPRWFHFSIKGAFNNLQTQDTSYDYEASRKKRQEEEDEKRRQDNDKTLTNFAMGDMLGTGIPGGIDMDFSTPW